MALSVKCYPIFMTAHKPSHSQCMRTIQHWNKIQEMFERILYIEQQRPNILSYNTVLQDNHIINWLLSSTVTQTSYWIGFTEIVKCCTWCRASGGLCKKQQLLFHPSVEWNMLLGLPVHTHTHTFSMSMKCRQDGCYGGLSQHWLTNTADMKTSIKKINATYSVIQIEHNLCKQKN